MEDSTEAATTRETLDLELAEKLFQLNLPIYQLDQFRKKEMYDIIQANDMGPIYRFVCAQSTWQVDQKVISQLRSKNTKAIEEFNKEIKYAIDNLSGMEVKDAYLNKANYLSRIGAKEKCLETLIQAMDHTVGIGSKIDNIFHRIRLGLFFFDAKLAKKNLKLAEEMLEDGGGDWLHRNSLEIYQSLCSLNDRDFFTATTNFLNAVVTFNCSEIISYKKFIWYTVLSAMLTLPRIELKKKVLDSPEILQALKEHTFLEDYVFSLYNCNYAEFFTKLGKLEVLMLEDMFLSRHVRYYIREMKSKAYNQLLSTYRSVSLSYMGSLFDVSSDFIEEDLGKMIIGGHLKYKMDTISNMVINMPLYLKTEEFSKVVKKGDVMINRLQKLAVLDEL